MTKRTFPDHIEKLSAKYPTYKSKKKTSKAAIARDKQDPNYIYAAILLNRTEELERFRTSANVADIQRQTSDQSETMLRRAVPGIKIPTFDLTGVNLRILGPRPEFREVNLEKYSRVYMIIRSL